MTLKEIRKNCKLTQKEASEIIKMPLRTYVAYETDDSDNPCGNASATLRNIAMDCRIPQSCLYPYNGSTHPRGENECHVDRRLSDYPCRSDHCRPKQFLGLISRQ